MKTIKKGIKNKTVKIFILSSLVTYLIVLGIYRLTSRKTTTNNKTKSTLSVKMKETISAILKPRYNYYESKKVTIDPVMVKELIDSTEKSYVIVDIRSAGEYKKSHIKNAINVPAYQNAKNVYQSLTNKNQELNREKNKILGKKLIIVYGYHPEADITDDMVSYLKKIGLPVRVLNVSWYEWRSNFYSWMPSEALQDFSINKYLQGEEMITVGQ